LVLSCLIFDINDNLILNNLQENIMSITLNAKARTVKGKKVKVLRREGLVPAEIYGNGDNASVQIVEKELIGAMRQAGTTKLILVDVEGSKYDVLVKEVVRSLDRKRIVHIDLFSVDKNAAVKAIVPITLIGESPLITKGGITVSGASEVEVLCLPDNIPADIKVDTTPIVEFSQLLTVADLVVEDGLEVLSNPSTMVAYVSQTRATREAAALEKGEEPEAVEE
jgi:large subunit ribosomal protein L25